MAAARSRGTRRLAVAVLSVVVVIGAVALAVPSLISSETVKKRISDQITHWTGRNFSFAGDAKLRLFPYLTVRLQDVRLGNPAGRQGGPFISAANMTGKLEMLPLLLGRLEFAEFRLGSPTVNLQIDAAGQPNWILDQGVVGTLASKGDSELPSDDPAPPSPRADVSLGRFIIRGGTVKLSDARNGSHETMTNVNMDLTWESTVEAAHGKGTFEWRSQPVAFQGEMSAPLSLLAGGDSPLRVAVEAAPANFSFEGIARQFDGMQLEGAMSLAVPSVATFIDWTGALAETSPIGGISIAGRISWADAKLDLDDMAIDIDGNSGEGALTGTLDGGRPSLQGTLDFARFDLTPQARALAAAMDAEGGWKRAPIRLPLLTTADIDLRLSAGSAVVEGREVGPVAASLLVKDGSMRVEVGEAHLDGGMIDASLRVDIKDGALDGAVSVKGEGLPAGSVASLFGVTGVTGTAEATVDLAGSGATWGEVAESLAGTATLGLADGTVEGVDITLVPQLIAEPDGAGSAAGTTSFDHATARLAIGKDAISTDDLSVEAAGYDLHLAGKVTLPAAAVEGRGVLSLLGETPRDVPFLLNGTWGHLRFYPDLGGTLPRDGDGRADPPPPTDG